MRISDFMGLIRAPFLLITPICIFLGYAVAIHEQGAINVLYAILAMIAALAAHIAVNALNEYYDFQTGLDLKTERTPFSGGSGTLPLKPELAHIAMRISIISLAVLFAIGCYFVSIYGFALIPLGLTGLLIVVLYTQWITRHPLICLIAPGLGIGVLMVVGTHFVLTGGYSMTALLVSLIPFFLVNNLLLLNQLPDIKADEAVGRRHIPVLYGTKVASTIFVFQMFLAYAVLFFVVITGMLPLWSLVGLITLVLAVPSSMGVMRFQQNIERLIPSMGMNVAINLITPFLVAVGLVMPNIIS